MLSRRRLMLQAGVFALGSPFAAVRAQTVTTANATKPVLFTAFRNSDFFGHHKVRFTKEGERLIVDVEISFDVKLAFIPFYRYRHRNREIWQDGRLLSLSTQTDDDGEAFEVRAEAVGDRLLVEGGGGKLDLPDDTLPTSYWNETIGSRGEWLDTQRGVIVRSKVTRLAPETIEAKGQKVTATPYRLEGDITCMLWYRNGDWAKLRFEASDGSIIDYTLDPTEGDRE